MSRERTNGRSNHRGIPKAPTGISGLDEITFGGLPRGRPTLICGSAGSGKTLLGMEFLVRGARQFNEPGVFMSFEEKSDELAQNVLSLGFDVQKLVREKKLAMDYVYIERSEIEDTGEYDLEALFIRLGHAIDSIGAKRVVLDTIEALFSGLPNHSILRAELRRLFRWLKDKGVTAIITGERGEGSLTRYGIEEYVSDCVILLDNRIINQIATRRLRIIKYRGGLHGTNEYPFLIDEKGFSVLPVSSLGLTHKAPRERIPTGIFRLDAMLGGGGYYRGSSILVSGTAGSGKSTIAAHFIDAACSRGERAIYFAFEESKEQIIRNMRSIGIDLEKYVRRGILQFSNMRPTAQGLEMHLVMTHKIVEEFKPAVVVVDPVTDFLAIGLETEVKTMLTRLIDFLKLKGITSMFTSLTAGGDAAEQTEVGISSLMDTWLLLKMVELNGERNRGLYILKSRGMAHSNQVREFVLTSTGIRLIDVYTGGEGGILMGAARAAQEARDRIASLNAEEEYKRKEHELERKRKALELQIAALQEEYETGSAELHKLHALRKAESEIEEKDRRDMARRRSADAETAGSGNGADMLIRRKSK